MIKQILYHFIESTKEIYMHLLLFYDWILYPLGHEIVYDVFKIDI